ncbi:MAG: AAA family ATPase [Sulfolobus sp.]|nr:AAA family ATPase [Sulfolobus sp.]
MTELKIISLVNQKGGTGKTTLTALIGIGLAMAGKKVLLIDADPQAHLSSFFIKSNELDSYPGILHMARGEKFRIVPINLERVKGKLGLIPSNLNYLVDVYRGQIPVQDPFALYKRLYREPAITKDYEWVITDTPPELFAPTIWALYASNYLIIPSNLEELSLMGIQIFTKDILPDVLSINTDLNILGTVLIGVTRKHRINTIKKTEDNLIKFIKDKIPRTLVSRFYSKLFFNTIIHSHHELTNLIYRPKRWELPLSRLLTQNDKIKNEVTNLISEIESRIVNFQGLS